MEGSKASCKAYIGCSQNLLLVMLRTLLGMPAEVPRALEETSMQEPRGLLVRVKALPSLLESRLINLPTVSPSHTPLFSNTSYVLLDLLEYY